MLSEEEKKAIELIKQYKNEIKNKDIKPIFILDTALNLITRLKKEIEHQKEKRENQKTELAILNEKQKDMNKLINDVKSYKGQFERQEREITKLQKENKEKDKQIDLMAEEITTPINSKEWVKEYYKNLARQEG